MIAKGEDIVAKFLVYSTVEAHEEMVEEAQMRKAKNTTVWQWLDEKKSRIGMKVTEVESKCEDNPIPLRHA